MAREGRMQEVELDDEQAGVDRVRPQPSDARRRWWAGGVAVVAVLGFLGFQLVVDARERAAVARLADVPGVLAPVDGALPVAWRSESIGGRIWDTVAVDDAIVGPRVDGDGSQLFVSHDLATGELLWSTPLYGPDPARAQAEARDGATGPSCAPTTVGPDPERIACLVGNGFVPYASEAEGPRATEAFVRVVDTADGRTVAEWPATGASLAVLDDVAVLASYDADGAVALDGRDLLTGDPRWTARAPAPEYSLPRGTLTWPPSVYRVGDDVAVDRVAGRAVLFDASGHRVHEELDGDIPDGFDGGGFVIDPASGRLIFTLWQSMGRSSTTVVEDERPGFTFDGDLLMPSVDDGSVPGLLLFAAVHPRSDGGDGMVVLQGVDADAGDVRWRADAVVSYQTWATMVVRGRVYVVTDDGLAAVDGRTGEVLWSVDAPQDTMFDAPRTDGRHVLVWTWSPRDGRVGDLVALDPATGEPVWRTALPDGVDGVVPIGDVLLGVVSDDRGKAREVVRLG